MIKQVQLQLHTFLLLQWLPVQLETVFWVGSDVQSDIVTVYLRFNEKCINEQHKWHKKNIWVKKVTGSCRHFDSQTHFLHCNFNNL